jgi:hypothetical protein
VIGPRFWRAKIDGTGGGYAVVVPALAPNRTYRDVQRLEGVVDWAVALNALGDPPTHGNVPVVPYAVGDAVLVVFVDDSPVILGRLV